MRARSQTWLGAAVVAAILAATVVAVLAGVRHERAAERDRRAAMAGPAIRALAAGVSAQASALDDLRAFFESSSGVTAPEFRRFTAAPLARQEGLGHLAWTPLGADGSPRVGHASGASPEEAWALVAAPAARTARETARDTAAPTMTAPFEHAGATATLIVAPVYAAGAPLDTPAQRRAALRGYVSALSRPETLGRLASADLTDGVALEVRDGTGPVIGTRPGAPEEGTIEASGREWTVGLSGVEGPGRALPAGLGTAGLALAAIVGVLFGTSAGRERSARSELEGLRVRHDLILGAAGDGIVGLDEEARATFVNPAAARMLGWDADDLIGGRFDELVLPATGPAARAGRRLSGEGPLMRRDGTLFTGEYTATPISPGDLAAGSVVVFRDVTERRRREERTRESLAAAEERAAVDPLTGLANHRTFHERLAAEVGSARRRGRALALVLMDLDHFKQVNDRHGHQVGDRVLQRAAEVLRAETRAGELVARVGGEEFAMLLPGADGEEAYRAAERVRRAVAGASFPEVGAMTMSAGVSDLSQGRDPDTLYRLADAALYRAKHGGRDMVARYSPGDAAPAPERGDATAGAGERGERRQAMVSMRLLARVVDAKHPSTRRHSERVADLTAQLATELGWAPERVAVLREAALLHDVGKIGVPEELLGSPRLLAPEEMERMRDHPALGARILAEALGPEQVAWVRGHHERWDGAGYPDGLQAEDCPEGARILALAEAWDAMTSDRPYSTTPRTHAEALAECRAQSGRQFWPPAVEALERVRGGA